jgi:hypothetical protein
MALTALNENQRLFSSSLKIPGGVNIPRYWDASACEGGFLLGGNTDRDGLPGELP